VGLSEPQSVAVADGRVFLTSTWRVLALDQTSGELLWCTEAGRMFMTAPTVSDGTVVFGTELPGGRGGVIAFDAADGTRRWRFPRRGPFTPRIGHPLAVPTVHRGTVYVGGGGGRAVLTALDLADGSVQWRTDLGDGGVTPPAVDGDRLFVQRSGELLALESGDGSIVWRSHAGGPALPPTSTDERVFGTASETGIEAWDSSTGRRQWRYDGTTDEPLSLATDGTDVAVSTLDGVHLLDAETGRARWRKSVGRLRGTLGSDGNGPARLRGCLLSPAALYLAVDGGFAVLDRDDGSVRWHVEFPRKSIGDAGVSGTPYDPVVVDGFAYLYLENGRVYALGV
jgi:outer membrane protein assembly factor BamB